MARLDENSEEFFDELGDLSDVELCEDCEVESIEVELKADAE